MNPDERTSPSWKRAMHGITVFGGALVFAFACFLVLPVLQAITQAQEPDLVLRSADTAELPPPPPPEPEQDEPEEDEPPPPPDLSQNLPLPTLDQLSEAMNPGFGGSGGVAGVLSLAGIADAGSTKIEDLFDFGGLEEQPRPVFKHRPETTPAMRKRLQRGACTVYVLLTVTKDGKVVNPTVHRSDDAMFNQAALAAIKKWKFQAGRRNGEPDTFRVRQPITFK